MGISYVPPGGGGGDVSGPGGLVVDNSMARWDGTAGTLLQDSGVIVDDSDNVYIPGRTRVGTNFNSPYKLSVQSNNSDTFIEILNNGGFGTGAFFGIENNGPGNEDQEFTLYNWQGGPIIFYTQTIPSAGLKRFQIENDGTLSIPSGAGSTANYETLVLDDDDIPNKKFIDDSFVSLTAVQSVGGSKTFTDNLNIVEGSGSGLTANSQADNLVIDSDQSNVGMSILCPSGGNGNIYFGEAGASNLVARVQYVGSTDELRIRNSGSFSNLRAGLSSTIVEVTPFLLRNGGTQLVTVATSGLISSDVAGYEALVVADGDVPNKKYLDDTHVKLSGDQTITGQITFADESIIIDAPTATGNLELGRFTDVAPECYGLRQTNTSGYFCFMPNASFPQIVLGSPTNTTGSAFIDVDNNRPLNLNVLDTGAGTPAVVNIGSGGLDLPNGGNITLQASNTVDGVDVSDPKNSIVVDSNQYQLENDAASPGNLKAYATDRNGARGWFDQRTEHVYNLPAVSLYPPSTGFSGSAFTLVPLNAAWYEQDAAGLEEDATNPWLWVRSFDSTNEEGAGTQVMVPSDAVQVSIAITGRASVPPSGTDNVRFELARRKIADSFNNAVDGSWTASVWDTYGLTDQNFNTFTTTATIASLGIDSKSVYMLQLVRTDAGVTDNLVDDFLVSHVRIEFS